MATAHPWGLLRFPAAASAAWYPASTGYLGGKAQSGDGGPYTVGGGCVCICTYARKHACTPETWPVEAPVKVCSRDWGTQPTFRGLFQGQAELVSLAVATLPTWCPQPCLSSLCVDIQNDLRGLSRSPGRTCHCSSLLGSYCLQEALPDIPLAGSAEGSGAEAHQSQL